jgi:hypothetical protein
MIIPYRKLQAKMCHFLNLSQRKFGNNQADENINIHGNLSHSRVAPVQFSEFTSFQWLELL